ncbi:MAG TPA: hypothetical protein VL371_14900 [Gemmataceae bacterium]|nr:hypothetical protein [Gemmataceae bacterium]
MFSFPPLPVVPASGESQILQNALKFARNNQLNSLDNLPIPFAVTGTNLTTGVTTTVKNNPQSSGGTRVDIDVDGNLATGKGGKDLGVTVSTELFVGTTFNPHLVMTVDRLGTAPFASNFEVLLSFPFSAFSPEFLSNAIPDPNLFIGFKTTGAASPDTPGGIAPLKEQISFIPNVMALATHPSVDITLDTTAAANPLQFITGYFSAVPGSGLAGIQDAAAYAAWVQQPPAHVGINVGVSNSAILAGAINGSINLNWTATAASKVVFDYLEEESGTLTDPDFDTKLTFDQMPTSEQLSLTINEAAKTLKLSHRANATVGLIQVLSERNDGLTITGTASQVPTEVDLTLNLAGSATIDVTPIGHAGTPDNNLDLKLEAKKTGGFLDTAAFLGYNLGYAAVELTDVPDSFIGFDPATDSVGVHAVNPGESIGSIALVIGDDANLELPPAQPEDLAGGRPWDDPARDVFSLIDDGTHGTAAARLVHVVTAQLNLNAASIDEAFTFKTGQAAPFTAYLRTTTTSNLIPGHDVEVTLNINSIPAGQTGFTANFPTDFSYDLPPGATIDSIHAFGHIDNLNFDFAAGNLPNVFSFTFDPNGVLTVKAEDGTGPNTAIVGFVAVRLWDPTGPGLLPTVAPASLLGDVLREARARVDSIPSFHATWSDAANTAINFDTDANDKFLGGAQVAVSTAVNLAALPAVTTPALVAAATDYLAFRDRGTSKQLRAGAFGIDAFSYASNDAAASYNVHYDADVAHRATVDFNSQFGGRFFPTFDIHGYGGAAPLDSNADLTLDKVPQLLDLGVDVDPEFHYHGSTGIPSITLAGSVDDTNDGLNNGTNILATLNGLPKDVDFVLHPASDATLTMNAPASLVALHLDSDNNIFGSGYRLLEASIADIPAHWNANWGGGQFLLEAKDAADNPAPMGVVHATISKSNVVADNINSIAPFQNAGPGGARINYSSFLQTIDDRYYNAAAGGGAATLAALNALYNNAQVLDAGEDHAVARINGGSLDFFDGQFTGFQKISYQPTANGGHYEFDAPLPGLHPFFAGVGLDGNFLFAQIDNVPDFAALDIDMAAHNVHFHTSNDFGVTPTSAVGNIDVYYGPENMAADGNTALRAVMQNVPDDVLLTWSFAFPSGGANFTASNEFTLLLLAQDGSHRLTAGLRLKELQASYDVEFDPHFHVGTTYYVPTSLNLILLDATAGIDNDTADAAIHANPAKPGVDGFFSLYSMTGSPDALSPAGPAPQASEYTPELSFLMRNFREFSVSLSAGAELFPAFLSPTVSVSKTLVGDFVVDFWAGKLDISTSIFGFDFGFLNEADYTDNTPIHLVPLGSPNFDVLHDAVFTFVGFHDFGDHFDPLA